MINIQKITASAYGVSLQPTIKGTGKKDPSPQTAIPQGEKVELSDTSITISRLREAIDALPEVRIKLVEDIKQRIQQNNYPFTTNLNKALDKMLENKVL